MADKTPKPVLPNSVLFVCTRNAVRSPIAESLLQKLAGDAIRVASAGVEESMDVDPFAVAVMRELDLDIADHHFKNITDAVKQPVDLIITLSADAQYRALLLKDEGIDAAIENWIIPNPTDTFGSREMKLQAYRSMRSLLATKIKERFAPLQPL